MIKYLLEKKIKTFSSTSNVQEFLKPIMKFHSSKSVSQRYVGGTEQPIQSYHTDLDLVHLCADLAGDRQSENQAALLAQRCVFRTVITVVGTQCQHTKAGCRPAGFITDLYAELVRVSV